MYGTNYVTMTSLLNSTMMLNLCDTAIANYHQCSLYNIHFLIIHGKEVQ